MNEQVRLPLTQAQFGIWLGQSISPDSTRYNAAEYLKFEGDLDVAAFMAAANTVMQQTTALNMAFEKVGEQPHHHFIGNETAAQNTITFIDLSAEASPSETAIARMKADINMPLMIAEGRNYRQALIKTREQQYIWYLCIHHIASDGYSFALLAQRVIDEYNNRLENIDASVGELSDLAEYGKLAQEDTAYRQSPYFEKDRTFWREQLAEVGPARSLINQSVTVSENTISSSDVLSETELTHLAEVAMRYQTSWGDMLFSLVAAQLYRFTGMRQTVMGMPSAGRMGSVASTIPCMHMNIVPVWVEFEGVETLQSLHQQLSHRIRKSRRHFRYRYEDLKQDLAKNTPDNRLFGAVVNILPFERAYSVKGCDISAHTLSAGPVEDIAFSFVKQPDGGLRLSIEANAECYEQTKLDEIKQSLLTTIRDLEACLEAPLAVDYQHLSILSAADLPDDAAHSTSLLARIYHQSEVNPHSPALSVAGGKPLSYCQLVAKVNRLTLALGELNLTPGQIITLAMPKGQDAIISMLAVLVSGQRFVCVDPEAPLSRNRLILDDADPALVLYASSVCDELKTAFTDIPHQDIALLLGDEADAEDARDWRDLDRQDDQQAYLIYTSGSSGTPKGVMISMQALNDFCLAAAHDYGIQRDDTLLQFAPLHFDACIEEIFVGLSTGAHVVVRNDAMLESMSAFLTSCQAWQISVLDLPTAFWHELTLAIDEQDLVLPASIRTVIIGGEAVKAPYVERWRQSVPNGVRLLNTYGPSEATVVATFADLSVSASPTSIGTPLSGRHIAVVDETLTPVPTGESGELVLLGAGLGDGYLGLTDKTADSFVSLSLPGHSLDDERGYRTGDRVCLMPCGNIEFLGRIDQQIKISGYRIEPGEIEHALLSLPDVADAAITVSISPDSQQAVIAAHLVSDPLPDLTALRQLLAEQLPAPMLPSALRGYETLPVNASGKVDKKALLESLELDKPTEQEDQQFSPFEIKVAGIWRDVLGIDHIGRFDDFFLIGGQSLQSIQVASRLSSLLARTVPVSVIFDHPRFQDLCAALISNQTAASVDMSATLTEDVKAAAQRLPAQIQPCISHDANTVMLTGATGFVGSQLLNQLLLQTSATIICPVRAANSEGGLSRVRQALQAQGLDMSQLHRVEVLATDLASPYLGLDESAYQQLAQRLDGIIHNAAVTSVMRDYQSLKSANVDATEAMLQLASIRGIPFSHVSTIAVAPSDQGSVPEDFVACHQGLKDGYQQSKWVAEALVEEASARGLPVNVYRLARVTGDRHQGYINANDLVWSIIRAGLNNKVLPDIQVHEPWTPVDIISEFMVRHSLCQPGEGVFNLTPERSVGIQQVFNWLSALSFDFRSVSIGEWCQILDTEGSDQDKTILSFFTRGEQEQNQAPVSLAPFCSGKYRQFSQKHNLIMPSIDRQIFSLYLQYGVEHDLIPSPKNPLKPQISAFVNAGQIIDSAETHGDKQ
ncbi:non-ribosomal peptide synthetase [Veronia pacifica]|uniref:Carrier domain-containing protein n=1 Tax=Veronia pacifica TaxID=1080227 RepID=A0A1C3EJX2_9GAMM|nr:non-ribosomal peptide synthetase [Veronia pacifica]ODA33541.1 hypothetical protein A8L45_10050 [Veronia pacifica]